MAIANNSNSLSQQVKTRYTMKTEDVNKIKLAIEALLDVQATQRREEDTMEEGNDTLTMKRSVMIFPENSPSKRQCIVYTDHDLDEAANEVSEVSEWESILENWNTELENLSFHAAENPLLQSV